MGVQSRKLHNTHPKGKNSSKVKVFDTLSYSEGAK